MRTEGVQAIIQKIHIDAEQHSNERSMQIKNACDEAVSGENALFSDDYKMRREGLLAHNEHEYDVLRARLSNRFNRELSTYRHSLVNEIFERAEAKLLAATDEELAGMFLLLAENIMGDFTLYMGENSVGKISKETLNKAMEANLALRVTLDKSVIPHKSGFMLSDEWVEYNCLFEDIIENQKNEQASLLIKEVFGEYAVS
ncbi:MAG: hypothetical protein LBI54_04820 [Lachnospiraceae bacterium]|jgi:hypothetical protein|nr:hypothetical protein [Lachnospiraceae bacterium]